MPVLASVIKAAETATRPQPPSQKAKSQALAEIEARVANTTLSVQAREHKKALKASFEATAAASQQYKSEVHLQWREVLDAMDAGEVLDASIMTSNYKGAVVWLTNQRHITGNSCRQQFDQSFSACDMKFCANLAACLYLHISGVQCGFSLLLFVCSDGCMVTTV